MTELLVYGAEYDPELEYGAENIPSLEAQREFFRYALMEGAEIDTKPRLLRGPLQGRFFEVMKQTDKKLKGVNPAFTAEHIVPTSYQSKEARQDVLKLTPMQRIKLGEIKSSKALALGNIARDPEIIARSKEHGLESGLLGVPPYACQVDGWKHMENVRGCTNACFRMVFGGITGWVPSQEALSTQLIEQYGTSVVDDHIYSALYQTEIFSEICDKAVTNIEIMGAELDTIAKIARSIKAKREGAEVYCTVNLSSETAGGGVWHTAVLLESGKNGVTCHDPSASSGGEYRTMPHEKFLDRWAVTHNRAVLTIAA